MHVPPGDHESLMAGLRINDGIGCGDIFVPDQLFAFGSILLHADPSGCLDQVESLTPGQAFQFGKLEYDIDSRGELVFSGEQLEDALDVTAHGPDSISEWAHDKIQSSDSASSLDPNNTPLTQASSPSANFLRQRATCDRR